MNPDEQFVLNLTTLAAIGGIMGVLTGAISFLTKALISSKDEQIAHVKEQQVRNEKRMAREIEYWRSFSVHLLEPAEQARLDKMFADRAKEEAEEDDY